MQASCIRENRRFSAKDLSVRERSMTHQEEEELFLF